MLVNCFWINSCSFTVSCLESVLCNLSHSCLNKTRLRTKKTCSFLWRPGTNTRKTIICIFWLIFRRNSSSSNTIETVVMVAVPIRKPKSRNLTRKYIDINHTRLPRHWYQTVYNSSQPECDHQMHTINTNINWFSPQNDICINFVQHLFWVCCWCLSAVFIRLTIIIHTHIKKLAN